MVAVVMYATALCPYCRSAERLLASKGVRDVQKIRVDLDRSLREEMVRRCGRRSVPQIWIGDRHVGGFDDLYELEREGKLDDLLKNENAASAASA